ncbi:alpha-amylase family glycosyl hydrolase [Flammeovirga aprica]|uniref:Alpha-amylase n=1 Tax=Flammeovirga aprica JL-4 TaxID=694437 RepID=A0A7X9XAN0_9BACT|nr:alpha-amylase family glycosyl hydrolase [Flammeovirga aprica]NME69778.1 alpha-amylase [Flammeovirga aprica JL-4]
MTNSIKSTNEIVYQIFVRSFADSNGDDVGDILGVVNKLEYLHDLGITMILLMPVTQGVSYHKYDITDHYQIDEDYGSINDLKHLIEKAHQLKIKVILDFVINHTSTRHPWFVESCKGDIIELADGKLIKNKYRDFYEWKTVDKAKAQGRWERQVTSDSDNKIPWSLNPYNPSDSKRYYSYFWKTMPDLNFDNEEVKLRIFNVAKWWINSIGIDGFRLDAAKHIFETDEEKNISFLKELRNELFSVKRDVFLVGEVWGGFDEISPYFKALPALFNFQLSYEIMESCIAERAVDMVRNFKNYDSHKKNRETGFYNCTFLSNHDQNRILSQLNNDIDKAKIASSMLLTFPGTPFLYYGEEVGMKGEKPDEYIREPILWSDSNFGKTNWIPSIYNRPGKTQNVDTQKKDPNSLFHHYRRLIQLRKSKSSLMLGTIDYISFKEFPPSSIVAFKRTYKSESLYVIINLSREKKNVTLTDSIDFIMTYNSSTENTIDMDCNICLSPYSTIVFEAIQTF